MRRPLVLDERVAAASHDMLAVRVRTIILSTGASIMAKKAAAAPTGTKTARKRPARKRSTPRMTSEHAASARRPGSMPGFGDMSKMPKVMTAEQAIELYKANAALALEVINTAIESAARLRRKQ